MRLLLQSRLFRVLIALLAVAITVVITVVIALVASTAWLGNPGAMPQGKRLARMPRSPNYRDGAFRNPYTTRLSSPGSLWTTLKPWLGHSTVLVESDAARILFDPVWARRSALAP